MVKLVLYTAFFASGALALVWEVLWVRQLSLLMGNTTEAVTSVLAAFMLGISLGSAWSGRRADSLRDPLRRYAWIEVGIGAAAIVVTRAFESAGPIYRGLAVAFGGAPMLFPAVRFAFAFGLVLIPVGLMGATLPILARYVVRRLDVVGGEVARLYAFNTLGAAAGTFATGFYALPAFGIWQTGVYALLGNLAVAVAVLLVARWAPAPAPAPTPVSGGEAPPADGGVDAEGAAGQPAPARTVAGAPTGPGDAPGSARLVWPAVALGGLTGLACEVIWTRVLVFSLGASAYAFSVMLSIFLVGLALGSLAVSASADRLRRPVAAIGALQIAAAVAIAWTTLGYVSSLGWIRSVAAGRGSSFVELSVMQAAALMAAPTLVLGMILPLGSRVAVTAAGRVGRSLGELYALNTLGSIAGSLLGGFVGIPVFGTQASLLVLAALNLGMGTWVVLASRRPTGPVVPTVVAAVGVVGALLVPASFLDPVFVGEGRRQPAEGNLVRFEEGRTATVTVYQDLGYRNPESLRLFTNGTSMTGTTFVGRRYMKLLGHLPVLLHPDPERVLTICFGTGMTFGATAMHPEVERSMCAELSRTVLEVAPIFDHANGGVRHRERAEAVVADGRQMLLSSPDKFDVITAEPPPPRDAGTYQLYSREFYQIARDRLRPGGIVAQWLPLHDQSELEVRMLTRSFQDVFPHTTIWLPVATEGILIGSDAPIRLDVQDLARRMARPEVKADLEAIGIPGVTSLLATFLMNPVDAHRYSRRAPALVDDLPLSDFFVGLPPPMTLPEVDALLAYRTDVRMFMIEPAEGVPTEGLEDLDERMQAHDDYLEGLVHNQRERVRLAVDRAPDNAFYRDTLSLSPRQRGVLRSILEASPASIEHRAQLARVLLTAGEHDDAVALARGTTELFPRFALGHFNLGYALEQAGRLGEARAAYVEALGLDASLEENVKVQLLALATLADPGQVPDPALRVDALQRGGHPREARREAAGYREAKPDDPEGWFRHAELLHRTGRHQQARRLLDRAVRRFPEHAGLRLLLADAALALGRPEVAIRTLDRTPEGATLPAGPAALLRARALVERRDFRAAGEAVAGAGAAGVEPRALHGIEAAIRHSELD